MAASRPKLLVLDGQGVVFDAPIKRFLKRFSNATAVDYAVVEQRWESTYRQLAWSGAIEDAALWQALAGKSVDTERVQTMLDGAYRPGPAAGQVARWSRSMPIWLLSNHRSHWIVPKLRQLGLGDAFQRLLVSDLTGAVKPDAEAFRQLIGGDMQPGQILFVDDQQHNVAAAGRHGLRTIHAAPGQDWIAQIEAALSA